MSSGPVKSGDVTGGANTFNPTFSPTINFPKEALTVKDKGSGRAVPIGNDMVGKFLSAMIKQGAANAAGGGQRGGGKPIYIAGGGGSSSAGGAGGSGAGGSGAGGASSAAATGQSQTDLLTRKLLAQLLADKKASRTKKGKSSYNKKAKSAYNKVKKAKTAQINARKKQEVAIGKAAIKRLPKKQQASARKQFNAKIKQKYDAIKSKIPSSSGKSAGELVSLMRKVRTMRV